MMIRCTEWRGEHAAIVDNHVNYIDRLAQYEDTGLAPEEIQEIVDILAIDDADVKKRLLSWADRYTGHRRKCDNFHKKVSASYKEET